jgi:hypothetical protein
MLQWLYMYVVSVCFKCFSCFRSMLRVFYPDVAYVAVAIHICCKICFKCFTCFRCMLQQVLHVASVFISRHRKRAQAKAVPACMRSSMACVRGISMHIRRISVASCERFI